MTSLFFLLGMVAWAAPEDPKGGLAAEVNQGRLGRFASWWEPSPGLAGKWWWDEGSGGSVWVRVGSLQVGPLVQGRGGDGWVSWSPGTDVSSGNWGLGLDGKSWGIWALQSPETLASGAQGRITVGSWSWALGADRTWSLEQTFPSWGPWADRIRTGLTMEDFWGTLGGEVTAVVPGQGVPGWETRAHLAVGPGSWSLAGKAALRRDPCRPDRPPWEASGKGSWAGWFLGWAGEDSQPPGTWTAGWKDSRLETAVSAGFLSGLGALGQWVTELWATRCVFDGQLFWSRTGWRGKLGTSVRGSIGQDKWSLAYKAGPGSPSLRQTFSARWLALGWEAEAQWVTEGLRLGWIGPGASFDLEVRWLF